MALLLTSPVLWVGAALVALFWALAWIVPNGPLLEAMRLIQISVATVVVIAYSPYALQAIRVGRPDRVGQLSLGISLGFASVIANGLWSLLWRLAGQPKWMPNTDLNGFWIWLSILAAVLHITAPGAIDGIVPRRNWIMLGLAFGAGALFAMALLATQPDVAAFVARLEPWLRE